VALGVVEPGGQAARLTLALGGHPPPFVLRAGGAIEAVGRPGSLLGVMRAPSLREVTLDLQAGDSLLLYTDGATETKTRRGRLGVEGLTRILKRCDGLNAMELVTRVENEIGLRREGAELDDLALLAVRLSAAA
jgi:serine phosphatase RsbU (regulator of sigma subunit)